MLQREERNRLKAEALLCCDLFLTEGQSALNNKLNTYNFTDKLIIELLVNVYADVKLMRISHEEGRYRQNAILGVCEIDKETEE